MAVVIILHEVTVTAKELGLVEMLVCFSLDL